MNFWNILLLEAVLEEISPLTTAFTQTPLRYAGDAERYTERWKGQNMNIYIGYDYKRNPIA